MSANSDEYYSIEAPSTGMFKDQKSKFYAFAYPVESEAEVKRLLEDVRNVYHDARHHCCAYRIGCDGQKWRASDDGEPSGSAGRPILGQIDSASLSDVAVIVVRYFGGIKLGVPGLISAYKAACADALNNATRITKIAGKWYTLRFDYSSMPEVMKVVKEMNLPQRNQDYGCECSLEVRVRTSLDSDFLKKVSAIPKMLCNEK